MVQGRPLPTRQTRRLIIRVEMFEILVADSWSSPFKAKREIESGILAHPGLEAEIPSRIVPPPLRPPDRTRFLLH